MSFFSTFAQAQLPSKVADALKIAGIPQESVAIYVQPLDVATPTISHNINSSLNPASVMKLLTTYAAIDLLTPAYRWKTEIYHDGSLDNGVLNGNLIIKGYGDPSFKAQEFWRLLMSLQQAGIQEIKGDLVIDKSYFANNVGNAKFANETFDKEIWRAYNAGPSAFLVNGRSTSFKFVATDGGINISQEFALPEIQIINHMKLSNADCGEWRSRFGYTVIQTKHSSIITFSGTFSPKCGERYLELSLLDDGQYAFYSFKKLWRELGGVFNGGLKIQEVPLDASKLLEQASEPLGYVVRDINKWSNNLMARQLLLTLAAEKVGLPADEAKGIAAITAWLGQKNLQFDELVIENGSGLSRIERISAQHLGQLLVSAYNSAVMPEYMASFSIAGLDGTAQKRLKGTHLEGRAHLKTGSIDGVSTIAGYVLDNQNRRHVLVMLVNDNKAGASRIAQDALINCVYQESVCQAH
ncbi:MAG TPA: D-alanyl-D-alanine carboxypeptidase/D-alanyl-D-alanine-endopeptidase [Methylotenera sp.]|nr:D-alanyl-D-alanine carboxypeptidase/D-alanyl-D-alanine-endopeptidase [Methylotenera sp.]